jgi:hypothetical protein
MSMAVFSNLRSSKKLRSKCRRGAITLEWVLLATLIVIGTVGGVAAVRNALILEYQEMIETICDTSVGP